MFQSYFGVFRAVSGFKFLPILKGLGLNVVGGVVMGVGRWYGGGRE